MNDKEIYQQRQARLADDLAWDLGLEDHWESRIQAEPITALESLRTLYGKRVAGSEETEALYWNTSVAHLDRAALAEAVLARLRFAPPDGPLLDLGVREWTLLLDALCRCEGQTVTTQAPAGRARRPTLRPQDLALHVLEPAGHFAQAAALYALAHEAAPPEDRRHKILLRHRFCRAFHCLKPNDVLHWRRCVRFATATAKAAEALRLGRSIPVRAAQEPLFEVQAWLGERYEEMDLFDLAAEAYGWACSAASRPEDQLKMHTLWAWALHRKGDPQRALEMLTLGESDFQAVDDKRLGWRYLLIEQYLLGRLGGTPLPLAIAGIPPRLEEVLLDVMLHHTEAFPDGLETLLTLVRAVAEEIPTANVARRYERALLIALLGLAASQEDEAETWLAQAESLEPLIEDAGLKLERQILLAHRHHYRGDTTEAVRALDKLLPEAQRLFDADRLLRFLGQYLLTTAGDPGTDLSSVERLVAHLLACFQQFLREQPGGGARRWARMRHQRSFEGAMAALLAIAERVGMESEIGQACLRRAWLLLAAVRNPELHWQRGEPLSAEEREHLDELDKEFHRQLRLRLLVPAGEEPGWKEALGSLHDYQIANLTQGRVPVGEELHLPTQGVAVTFFEITDIAPDHLLVVLSHQQGTFRQSVYQESQHRLVQRPINSGTL